MLTVAAAFRLMIASSILSLAVVAFLFAWRDPSRKAFLLYAGIGAGLAAYEGLPALQPVLQGADDILLRAGWVLSFALPAVGYSFLLRFEEIPIGRLRRSFVLPPLAGAAFSVFPLPAIRPWLPAAATLCLALLATDFLVALWKHGRRRRPEAPLLFVGMGGLLFAVAGEAALDRGVLLVAVADQDRQIRARATTDPLTGLANRAAFLERAARELERSSRAGSTLCLVIFDVDRFKLVNDRFGHPQGDRVLVSVARAIQKSIRGIDLSGRWGGEEFVLLFVDLEEEDAFVAVERVRRAIAAVGPPLVPERVTVSAGLVMHHGRFDKATTEQLIGRADAALYRAKAEGRDRTVRASPGPQRPSTAADVRYR